MENMNGHSDMDNMIKAIGLMASFPPETGKVLNIADVIQKLNEVGYANSSDSQYKRVDIFIRNAYEYYSKTNPIIANNIKEYFEKDNGEKVIIK
jgi:hypothetical protein